MLVHTNPVRLLALSIAAVAFLLLKPPSLAAEKRAVTIKNEKVQSGVVVDVEMDVERKPGEMSCTLGIPKCAVPTPGSYVIATDEKGTYQDCVDDVGLFPKSSHFADEEKIGTYCLLSPEDHAVYSCPVILTDLKSVDATVPYVTMSVKNTSGKSVTAIEIGYASIDRIGVSTTATSGFSITKKIEPNQSFLLSTIGVSGDRILDHQRKSDGVGTVYFLDDVKFTDGSEWKADPVDHPCGVKDDSVRSFFAPK